MGRKWLRRGAAGLAGILLIAGVWTGTHWSTLRTRYAAHRLQAAATEEERTRWADALAAHGDEGTERLLELLRASGESVRSAAAAALERHMQGLPANDPRGAVLGEKLLDLFADGSEDGREALVGMLPRILDDCGALHRDKCRGVVALALKMPSVPARLAAIRAAMNPEIDLRGAIVPLLDAAEPEVRRAALFALGPATDAATVIGDEELFRWLFDADSGVRTLCREALLSRGRTETEIGLGRRLADPEPGERLKLLLDLRYDDLADPEPWLERLSRDTNPGVRAGAVRVMMELAAVRRLPAPPWVVKMQDSDPDPTVQRIARYYRKAYLVRSTPQ
ncbi:MAG TPA: hypothetical protein VN641_07880 [Urbifossiella sp.]|nr:hypothetical protein [Urbifossiella sp.]